MYFEKQRAALCAVHAINNLLQRHVFTESDFAEIAAGLSATESQLGASEPVSYHVSLSGDFSIEVINKALEFFGIQLINLKSSEPTAVSIRNNPTSAEAFVLNRNTADSGHWLSIRSVNGQFIELDSLKPTPVPISHTLLELTIDQYLREGYTVFVCNSPLPSDHDLAAFESNPPDSSDTEYMTSEEEQQHEQQQRMVEQERADFAVAMARSMMEK
ncbi:hypothetical protein GEMRC1_002888 [Eukaryota sp. GEM-RC1]